MSHAQMIHSNILSLSVISDLLVDSDGATYTWGHRNSDFTNAVSLWATPANGGSYLVAEFEDIYTDNITINKTFSVVALPIDGVMKEFVALSLAKVSLPAIERHKRNTVVGFRPVNWDSMVHYGLYVSRLHDSIFTNTKRSLRTPLKSIGMSSEKVTFVSTTGEYSMYDHQFGTVFHVSTTRACGNYKLDNDFATLVQDIGSHYVWPDRQKLMTISRQVMLTLGEVFRSGKFDTARVMKADGTFLPARISYDFSECQYKIEIADTISSIMSEVNIEEVVARIPERRRGDTLVIKEHTIDPFEDQLQQVASLSGTFCIYDDKGETIVIQFTGTAVNINTHQCGFSKVFRHLGVPFNISCLCVAQIRKFLSGKCSGIQNIASLII